MEVKVRRAVPEDAGRIAELLCDIAALHHVGRPDLFRADSGKYGPDEVREIIGDEDRPVFAAADATGRLVGYVLCAVVRTRGHAVMRDHDTLYIDDFCVDARCRSAGVGKKLFLAVQAYAEALGVYDIDLNVWEFNNSAIRFYEHCGMKTKSRKMEKILRPEP